MKMSLKRIGELDGKTCFICGKYLLNYASKDMAYQQIFSGGSQKARPERYHLFGCPNCGKVAHKRCWYDVGERKVKKGWFKKEWRLACPSCQHEIAPSRPERGAWRRGYQIPGHPDDELIELHTGDVFSWKAGSMIGKVGKAIGDFFTAIGLSSLTQDETSAVNRAAKRIGKTLKEVAERVFKLNLTPEERSEIVSLKCQNCGAPLPLPEPDVEAVVCEHCGTAHLLPT